MNRYCIGRVEGRWKNFVPPIQGGRFRAYCESSVEEHEDVEDDAEVHPRSSDISRTPSPVFDSEQSNIRKRGRNDRITSSASSISSVADLDDGISWLDVQTKEQITLDLAKYPSLDL